MRVGYNNSWKMSKPGGFIYSRDAVRVRVKVSLLEV